MHKKAAFLLGIVHSFKRASLGETVNKHVSGAGASIAKLLGKKHGDAASRLFGEPGSAAAHLGLGSAAAGVGGGIGAAILADAASPNNDPYAGDVTPGLRRPLRLSAENPLAAREILGYV